MEELAEAIERLDIPLDRDGLVAVLALRDRLDAAIAVAAGEFDSLGLWDIDGATSMTAWLRAEAAMTSRSAKRLAATGRRLRQLPVCAAADADGTLSGGQVDAILAHVDDVTIDTFADHEAELVPYLAPSTVAGCSRAMAAWKSRVAEPAEPAEAERSLYLSATLDDRYLLEGSLDAEAGAVVAAALRLATTDDTDGARSPATRRADAMYDVCRFYVDHQQSRCGGRHRPHLNVVVDLDALEEGPGGPGHRRARPRRHEPVGDAVRQRPAPGRDRPLHLATKVRAAVVTGTDETLPNDRLATAGAPVAVSAFGGGVGGGIGPGAGVDRHPVGAGRRLSPEVSRSDR